MNTMMKVISFPVCALPNYEAYNFHSAVCKLALNLEAESARPLSEAYRAALERFREKVDDGGIRPDAADESVAQARQAVDDAFAALAALINEMSDIYGECTIMEFSAIMEFIPKVNRLIQRLPRRLSGAS